MNNELVPLLSTLLSLSSFLCHCKFDSQRHIIYPVQIIKKREAGGGRRGRRRRVPRTHDPLSPTGEMYLQSAKGTTIAMSWRNATGSRAPYPKVTSFIFFFSFGFSLMRHYHSHFFFSCNRFR